jgi:twitching motility protein PilT
MNNLLEYSEGFDTDFAYEVRNLGRFRINLFKNNVGVAAVLRLIPDKIPTLEDIHAPDVFMNFCDLAKGLVLVTGPTGSGKSTTLAAMIDHINKSRSDHIITIEDPIEFVHAQKQCLVNQREVGRHTSTFSRALRAALREDPDVILVGEMRDLETISMALESAETGHLVFGTLHTNTAVATIDRIIDIFPGDQQQQVRSMLATTLKGVVCQTLMKNRKGGRVAAYEILVSSDAVSTMIREGKSHMIQNHMLTQKSDGNLTFNESLVALLADQSISLTDALSYAGDKKSLINLAKRRGVSINLDQINPADKLLLAN